MAESTASLRAEIMALSGVDIMLNEDTFKSTYQIMDELSKKWEDLSDIAQATIIELVAGKHQGNVFSSLMANFDTAREALETSLNSSGSAMAEHEKWQQSLEARINSLKASWQSLSQTFMSSDFLKFGLDALMKFLDILNALIDRVGVLPTLLGGASIFKTLFGSKQSGILNVFRTFNNDLSGFANKVGIADKTFAELINTFKSGSFAPKSFSGALKGLTVGMNSSRIATIAMTAAVALFNAVLTMGISAAITFIISKFDDWIETSGELSDRIDDITSKYEEQHSSLMKLKGDYDTSNEDSMISKYGKLSKGVNDLGENVSLTTDEYAEYQSIVNQIASQNPKLVSGYNSQGDAILSCAGNVDTLAESYRNLIKEQNEEVLKNGEDYFKDFGNDYDAVAENTVNRINEIEELSKMSSDELKAALSNSGYAERISDYLESNGIKRDVLGSGDVGFETYSEHVIRALKEEQVKIKSILDEASADIEAYADNLGTVTGAYFETAFLGGDSDSNIGDYSNMSDRMQNIITQITSGFDSEFYADFLEKDNPYEALTKYYDEMLKAFNSLSASEKTDFEAAFDLKTKFNGGDISYGEYVNGLQDVGKLIEGLDPEIQTQIKLSLGLSQNENGDWVVKEYQNLLNRLTSEDYEIQLDTDNAKSFLDGLSSEELSVTIDFIENGNEDFNNAIQNYKDVLNEAKEAGVDFSKTTYGNIDTNARQVLEWNSENLKKYKDELMSWEADDASWDNVRKSYENTVSTVMGAWDTFEIDGKEVDIAFSPMLQTDSGAEVLSSGAVDTYINELISKATEDGKWDEAELIKLDAEGVEVDGQKIKGILADVGETAEATSKQMHFVGKDGALASAEDFLTSIVEEQAKLNEALNFSTNIEVDTTALEALNTALAESASAMGLTSESIDSLESKYRDLDSYDAAALFERTGNGIKVNREELAKLEKEQNDLKKSDVQKHIDSLTEAYNDNVIAIDECANATERARLISENEGYKSKIEELAQYQAQLEGVTGAYQRWINAQETPEDYEGYQAVAAGYEDVKDELSRGIMGNASKEYIDLLSGEDLQGGTIDDYYNAWKKLDDKVTSTGYAVKDFFTVNDDGDITDTGIDRFFESLQKEFSKGENVIAKYNDEAKKWEYDFSQENLQKIQDEWGIGIEAIEVLLEAAASAGYDVDWGGILDNIDLDTSDFETLVSYAEKMQTAYNKIDGLEDVDFNFTATGIEEAETEIEKARQAFSQFVNADGTVNLEADGAEEMQFILSTLIIQKQQLGTPAIMKVDTSQIDQAETDIIDVINKAQALQKAYENYEIAISTGVDVEGAKADLNTAIDGMEGTSVYVRADLKLPTDKELQTAKDSIGDIKVGATLDGTAIGDISTKIQTECTPEVIAKVTGLDETAIQNGSQQVVYTAEHSDVDNFINGLSDISKKIIYKYETEGTKPNPKNIERSITYKYKTEGDVPEAYGTAHATGTTAGSAFARGNWGIKGNGVALGGELGQELVVRDGRFFTIGDKGAEFFQYKKNDIVFNAAQTESLFKYGGIKGAKPRGKMLASGSAFSDGSAMSGGRAFAWSAKASASSFASSVSNAVSNAAKKVAKESKKAVEKSKANWSAKVADSEFSKTGGKTGSGGGSGGGGSSSSAEEDKFEETIDWIETKIDRIERVIDQLDLRVNSVYKSWSERNQALVDEIGKVGEEIDIQQQAYDRYLQQANSVGLDEAYASKVRDGTIDIETITDEALKEKIDDYKQWYEKAIDAKDAIAELKETESELYAQRVEHAAAEFEGVLGVIEHEKNMLEEYINQSEAQAWLVSKNYYDALASNERENIAELQNQKASMLAEFESAMNSGTIAEGSEAYYEMVSSIDEVTMSIQESHTALLEYEQTIQQLSWETFDLLQEKISSITEETEFLIELMSNDKLFDDNGKLTSEGESTMGLHGVAYNVNMAQADQAAVEAARLKRELEEDPYDTELEERYREMISLQQEYILAAEDEKDAIRDLVEEGIELEIEALEERIDKYNEALQSQKDLYDYQKKVAESTKEIASLEKQMAAYAGDDSEEARQKIQQIKVDLESARADLEETEYDKYISDTEQILDNLTLEYQEVLNMRLDNIDALISDMITEINSDAGIIGDTIREVADSVGYTLSESMNTIWDENAVDTKNVMTMYGEKFSTAQTTTNNALNTININLQNIINQLNSKAQANVKKATTSSTAKSSTAKKDATKKTTTTKTGGDGAPKVGDRVKFVSGQYYYDSQGKKPLGSHKQGEYVYITNINKKDWATHPYHISTGKTLGNGDLGWLKLNQISGYATGKKNSSNDEIAWTQEDGVEFIVRPSDGAILTPVAKRDSVLNAQASNNIWDMANSPAEFIKNNLNLGASDVPNGSNVNNYTQNLENVEIVLPNVKNYEEFLHAMKNDRRFENLITSMTIDRLAGKSSLAKGKAIK